MKHYEHPAMILLSQLPEDCLRTSISFGNVGSDGENTIDGSILDL